MTFGRTARQEEAGGGRLGLLRASCFLEGQVWQQASHVLEDERCVQRIREAIADHRFMYDSR